MAAMRRVERSAEKTDTPFPAVAENRR